MKELEKEYRYKVNDEIIDKIKELGTIIEEEQEQIDVALGYAGFDSLYKYGYVCRIRKKGDNTWIEVKKRKDDNTFIETKVPINNFNDGVKLYKEIGMTPYMYMKRKREILGYKDLKIFIDDVDLLGKYVEIEFQDVEDEGILHDFLNKTNIKTEKQPLYGDMIAKKLKVDTTFKDEYNRKLQEFLN